MKSVKKNSFYRVGKKTKKLLVDFTKIQRKYNAELKRLKSLAEEDLKEEEMRINDLPEVEDETSVVDVLSRITEKPSRLSYSELVKKTKEFVPKNLKSKNRCLEEYTDLEEVKGEFDIGDVSKYTAKKDEREVFIKTRGTKYATEESIDKFLKEVKIMKTLSDNNLGPELLEYFLCKDNNGEGLLFLVYEKLLGQSLSDFKKDNRLSDEQKEKIKSLINRCFKAGVIPSWLGENSIFIREDGSFVLTSSRNAKSTDTLLEDKKSDLLKTLDWITEDSVSIELLAIKSLVRQKQVKFNL
jgi:serine/threonine protein kinase